MSHPIIFNGGLGLGLMIVGLGLNATLRPNDHLRRLEFPIPTEPLAKKFSLALMRIWGIRNITVGVLISFIWATGDEILMAKALSAALAMPITDGFNGISRGSLSKRHGDKCLAIPSLPTSTSLPQRGNSSTLETHYRSAACGSCTDDKQQDLEDDDEQVSRL
ncbi:hypothetical protein LZL87_004376 [Fusarium oxysporum]|nr:hypothetical protein LZL87_004376 [Fusarium oxysporum]